MKAEKVTPKVRKFRENDDFKGKEKTNKPTRGKRDNSMCEQIS